MTRGRKKLCPVTIRELESPTGGELALVEYAFLPVAKRDGFIWVQIWYQLAYVSPTLAGVPDKHEKYRQLSFLVADSRRLLPYPRWGDDHEHGDHEYMKL